MRKMIGLYIRKGHKTWGFVNVNDYGIRAVIADINENDRALHGSCLKSREWNSL